MAKNPAIKKKRGRPTTKVQYKRVLLYNSIPIGRGQPKLKYRDNLMYVYIKHNETYDLNKHGPGEKFDFYNKSLDYINSRKSINI